jgi:hypothetical protein
VHIYISKWLLVFPNGWPILSPMTLHIYITVTSNATTKIKYPTNFPLLFIFNHHQKISNHQSSNPLNVNMPFDYKNKHNKCFNYVLQMVGFSFLILTLFHVHFFTCSWLYIHCFICLIRYVKVRLPLNLAHTSTCKYLHMYIFPF